MLISKTAEHENTCTKKLCSKPTGKIFRRKHTKLIKVAFFSLLSMFYIIYKTLIAVIIISLILRSLKVKCVS